MRCMWNVHRRMPDRIYLWRRKIFNQSWLLRWLRCLRRRLPDGRNRSRRIIGQTYDLRRPEVFCFGPLLFIRLSMLFCSILGHKVVKKGAAGNIRRPRTFRTIRWSAQSGPSQYRYEDPITPSRLFASRKPATAARCPRTEVAEQALYRRAPLPLRILRGTDGSGIEVAQQWFYSARHGAAVDGRKR